jgi:hypothetical protein
MSLFIPVRQFFTPADVNFAEFAHHSDFAILSEKVFAEHNCAHLFDVQSTKSLWRQYLRESGRYGQYMNYCFDEPDREQKYNKLEIAVHYGEISAKTVKQHNLQFFNPRN